MREFLKTHGAFLKIGNAIKLYQTGRQNKHYQLNGSVKGRATMTATRNLLTSSEQKKTADQGVVGCSLGQGPNSLIKPLLNLILVTRNHNGIQAIIGDLNQSADISNGVSTAEIALPDQRNFMFTHAASLRQTGSSTISTINTVVVVIRS